MSDANGAGEGVPTPESLRIIEGPSAWWGEDMAQRKDWSQYLGAQEVEELREAVAHTKRQGLEIAQVRRQDFPLPNLGPRLDALRAELLHGRGFQVLRGLPVRELSREDTARMFWGIGSYFGAARSQNAAGHLLGHVRDLGRQLDDPATRIYQTSVRQTYHTDSCDIVSLLCLHPARSGGESSLASSVTVYNEMVRQRPDLAAELFRPVAVDRREEVPAGRPPYFMQPVFNPHAGLLSTIYHRLYIESAQRFADAPRLSALQRAAMDLFDSLVEDERVHLNMAFEPGDVQLVHNHTLLHDRMGFDDWPEPERKRHLLRLWLSPPDGRPLPPAYGDRYGSVEIGNRGGIVLSDTKPHVPLQPPAA